MRALPDPEPRKEHPGYDRGHSDMTQSPPKPLNRGDIYKSPKKWGDEEHYDKK